MIQQKKKIICVCVWHRFVFHSWNQVKKKKLLSKKKLGFFCVEQTEIFFFHSWNRVKKKMFSEKYHNEKWDFLCVQPN